MNHGDSDFRYMALNDLIADLQTNKSFDEQCQKKIVQELLRLLKDTNGEVQNLAVKCLGPLVKKLKEAQLKDIVDNLCILLSPTSTSENAMLKDIAAIGLKTVVIELPIGNAELASGIIRRLVPKLTELIKDDQAVQVDTIDIVSELLLRFGHMLSLGNTNFTLQKNLQDTLLPLLDHQRAVIRKRTTYTLGNLAMSTNDDLFNKMVKAIHSQLKAKENTKDNERLRTLVGSIATLCRTNSIRLGAHLPTLLPHILKYLETINDDELGEICLQSLEVFVLKCPSEMASYIPKIIEYSLKFVKYDPNYNDDATDDEDEEMDVQEEEGEEEEEDFEYSDDDDMSWKVRKASSKLLASIIGTRNDLLSDIYQHVAPVLISRFKDREESVRVDILGTFTTLIRMSNSRSSDNDTNDPKILLRNLVPALSKVLAKQLDGKSQNTRQAGFLLLKELVSVLRGGLENSFGLFLPSIVNSLVGHANKTNSAAAANSNLILETLEFVRVCLIMHQQSVEEEIFHPFLAKLLPPVLACVDEKYYKISGGALLVLVELVKIIRPLPSTTGDSMSITIPPLTSPELLSYITRIHETILNRITATDVDLEVKERGIIALGIVLSQAGDVVPKASIDEHVLPMLVDRLKNELSRLTSVKVIKYIASSPLIASGVSKVDLSPILPEILPEFVSFLKKSNRQLRIMTLQTLETIFEIYGGDLGSHQISSEAYTTVLNELKSFLIHTDLHLLPLVLSFLCVLIKGGKPEHFTVVQNDIVPLIVQTITQTPHLLASGVGLENLLKTWKTYITVASAKGGENASDKLIEQTVNLLKNALLDSQTKNKLTATNSLSTSTSRQSFGIIASSIVEVCLSVPGSKVVEKKILVSFFDEVEFGGVDWGKNAKALPAAQEVSKFLAIYTVGEFGKKIDLSSIRPNIDQTLLSLLFYPSEEIKHASASALGKIALGNLPHYMPKVLEALKAGGKRRYLVLLSLKEVVSIGSSPSSLAHDLLGKFAPELWSILFANVEKETEEGTRNVISECLGKLSYTDPKQFLPQLHDRLNSTNAHARSTVLAAVRYTFTAKSADYDDLLRPMIVDFLKLMKDSDLNVRRVSLETLNSAAYSKPHLIRNSLDQLLPLLYNETIIKPELIHTVEMGPFKHIVDDGMETRKAAYDCMNTLLEACLPGIDIFAFLQRIIIGISDSAHDVKILNHMTLQKLITLSPTAVTHQVEDTVDALKETILSKTKTNAVKQEVEKNDEIVRSGVKTAVLLKKKIVEPASGNNTSFPKFDLFVQEVLSNTASPVAEVISTVSAEVEHVGLTGLDTDRMDID